MARHFLRHSTAFFIVSFGFAVAAQEPTPNPCALLTTDDIQAIVPKEHVEKGVTSQTPAADSAFCRYSWGAGLKRMALDISVYPASRMFAGMTPDAIKQAMVASVVPDTTDATIADVGEIAVFRAYSPVYVGASAYLKGRVLQVSLDGLDARDRKGDLVSLLKKAASRF